MKNMAKKQEALKIYRDEESESIQKEATSWKLDPHPTSDIDALQKIGL